MNSIQSNALEPTRSELKDLSLVQKATRLLPVYGLVILMVFLLLLFSVLLPTTFPTLLNLRSIISDKAIILILSLGVMIPMSAGRIDLTVGYGIVLWHILAISLQTSFGFPWPVAVVTVLLLGALMGVLNGLLVESREDRQLHRHARHRHDPLRTGAVAFGRPADRRRACPTTSTR